MITIRIWLGRGYLRHHTSTERKTEEREYWKPSDGHKSLLWHNLFIGSGAFRHVASTCWKKNVIKNLLACFFHHGGQHKFGWFIVNYNVAVISISLGWPNNWHSCVVCLRVSGKEMKSDKLQTDFRPFYVSWNTKRASMLQQNLINVETEIYCLRMQFDGWLLRKPIYPLWGFTFISLQHRSEWRKLNNVPGILVIFLIWPRASVGRTLFLGYHFRAFTASVHCCFG